MRNKETDAFCNACATLKLWSTASSGNSCSYYKNGFSSFFKLPIIMLSAQISEHFVAIKGEDSGRLKTKANKTTILPPTTTPFTYEIMKVFCFTRGI